jgi:L-ascorbate metabolism protein UlaG (beta-lactamase superfamily)
MSFKITWYGHAAFALETAGYNLLLDPYLKGNPAAAITPDKVTADYILITHGHGDHVGDTVEIAKRTGATVISNAEISKWMTPQTENSRPTYRWCHIHSASADYGVHGSTLPDGAMAQPVGFLLATDEGKKIHSGRHRLVRR